METQAAVVMSVETGTAKAVEMGMRIGMGTATVLQNVPMPAEKAKTKNGRMSS
jgi:hypothetical protein